MTREFTPGDVVLDPDQTGAARVALVVSPHFSGCPSAHREYGVHVHYGDGDWNALKDRFMPLVVIDPEDREQVERFREIASRLADWVDYDADCSAYTDAMQAALREYADPKLPKPDEPQGLGAVVEDEDGYRWVNVFERGMWQRSDNRNEWRADWSDVPAVRVLSPGVEVDQ